MRHFILETDFQTGELPELFSLAHEFKRKRGRHTPPTLQGQSWALVFYKSSTRTRLSFEVGISELGGYPVLLDVNRTQIGRGESPADTARIFSGYLHGLIIRCYEHSLLETYAREGSIPVVNALSDFNHPCQVYSDCYTLAESWTDSGAPSLDSLRGRKVVFFGDTNCNMAHSWMLAAGMFDLEVVLCGPENYAPDTPSRAVVEQAGFGDRWTFEPDPAKAVEGADAIYTDVWVSMGMEEEEDARLKQFTPYSVTTQLMDKAGPGALFLHCLPAYPDREVERTVLNSPASVIWRQAENRLHVQKAILSILRS